MPPRPPSTPVRRPRLPRAAKTAGGFQAVLEVVASSPLPRSGRRSTRRRPTVDEFDEDEEDEDTVEQQAPAAQTGPRAHLGRKAKANLRPGGYDEQLNDRNPFGPNSQLNNEEQVELKKYEDLCAEAEANFPRETFEDIITTVLYDKYKEILENPTTEPATTSTKKLAKDMEPEDLPPAPPKYFQQKYGTPFFDPHCERLHHVYNVSGDYVLLKEFHRISQFRLLRRTTGRAPTANLSVEEMFDRHTELLAIYDDDMIKAFLKGTPSDYIYKRENQGVLPKSPDPTGSAQKIGSRLENYILLLCNEQGHRLSIGRMREVITMIQQYCDKVQDRGSGVRPIRHELEEPEIYKVVQDIDTQIEFEPNKHKDHPRERRYFENFEDVRVAREWADRWMNYLNIVCQRDFSLKDHDTCPKNVTHVGFTVGPDERVKAHAEHKSSSRLMYLVDAAALVVSKRMHKASQNLGTFKMRYHTLRLIHSEDNADPSEHYDSMMAGSYIIFGGTNSVYGGNNNISAHSKDHIHLYEPNERALELDGRFARNLERISANFDREQLRVKVDREIAIKFKECKDSWNLIESDKRKSRDGLRELNNTRADMTQAIEEWSRHWFELMLAIEKHGRINEYWGTLVRAVAKLPIYSAETNRLMLRALAMDELPGGIAENDEYEQAEEGADNDVEMVGYTRDPRLGNSVMRALVQRYSGS